MALVTTDAAALVEGTARFASAARRPTQTPRPGASRDRSASSASGTRSRQCWRSCDGISSISCRAHTARPADRVVWRAGGAPWPAVPHDGSDHSVCGRVPHVDAAGFV